MNNNYLAGVTVLPEYLQYEGVETVLDRLQQAGFNTIATSPYVMEPATSDSGAREPPADAGAGSVRLLDRPLWGKSELYVRTEPSFQPDPKLYAGLRYQPASAGELTRREGSVVRNAVDAAHRRGMRVYLQVQAAIPPGYRVQFGGPHEEDLPRMPDGGAPQGRVANNGSLDSPAICDYQHAFIRDICANYGDVDGIRFDWPEYPPYRFDSIFVDFSEHARAASGYSQSDFQHLAKQIGEVRGYLLSPRSTQLLVEACKPGAHGKPFWDWLYQQPGVSTWLELKAAAVCRLLNGFREVMNQAGGVGIRLAPASFPPPWSMLSGMDARRTHAACDEIAVKFYGMHWLMILGFYHQQLTAGHSRPQGIAAGLAAAFDIIDDDCNAVTAESLTYPEPDQPHRMTVATVQRKMTIAQQHASTTPVHALAHSYGPVDDFRSRLQAAYDSAPHGLWVNRYAYLSDAKLSVLGQVLGGKP